MEFQNDDNDKVQTATYSISSADTWEKKTITISGDTASGFDNDANRSFRVIWWLAAGSNYTSNNASSGAWISRSSNIDSIAYGHAVNVTSSTSNTFYLTGCQLEVGTSASDFEFLPTDVNLQRCQRYFYKLIDVPGGDANGYFTTGYLYSSSALLSWNEFPTIMRAAPTLSVASGTDYYIFYRDSAADYFDDFDLVQGRVNGGMIRRTSQISGTAGQAGGIHSSSNSKITFSSEL
jgi:hypothetical protein